MKKAIQISLISIPLFLGTGCAQVGSLIAQEETSLGDSPLIFPVSKKVLTSNSSLTAIYGLTRLLDETTNPEGYNSSNDRDESLARTYRLIDQSPIIEPRITEDRINSYMTRVKDGVYSNY